jgi:hypothetical protein
MIGKFCDPSSRSMIGDFSMQNVGIAWGFRRPLKFVDIYKLYKLSSVVDPSLISL